MDDIAIDLPGNDIADINSATALVLNVEAGGLVIRLMIGALLFVISDSVLAVNKFYESFELSGLVIMFTYGLAQLFITEGAMKYIRRK